jgi:putative membrane protein
VSARAFFEGDARRALSDAAADVEARTSTSLLVAVRPRSASYRHAHYLGGALVALAALGAFLYHPEPFDTSLFPLEQAVFFALGALLVGSSPWLCKLLAGERTQRAAVRAAAREAFVDLGVAQTASRTGILVFVSVFEGRVELIADSGVDVAALGVRWDDAQKKLERAVRRDADPAALAGAVRELGTALEQLLPCSKDAADDESPEQDADDDERGSDAARGSAP